MDSRRSKKSITEHVLSLYEQSFSQINLKHDQSALAQLMLQPIQTQFHEEPYLYAVPVHTHHFYLNLFQNET